MFDFYDAIDCRVIAHQAPLSKGLPRQKRWSGFPFPSPGVLPDPRIKPTSPALAGRFFTTELPGRPHILVYFGNLGKFVKCQAG